MWDSKKKIFTAFFVSFIIFCLAGLYLLRNNALPDPDTTPVGPMTPTPTPLLTQFSVCPEDTTEDCDYEGSDGIQQAIVAASDGAIILIRKGQYEQVTIKIGIEGIAPKQRLIIMGEGPETILNGEQLDHVFTIAADSQLTITDLTISNGGGDGINVSGEADVIIEDCTLTEHNYSALAFLGTSTGTISHNLIAESKTYGGITAGQNSNLLITGNEVRANRTFGIEVQENASIEVFSNIIYKNGGSGIGFFHNSSATVRNNTLVDNSDHGLTINDNSKVSLTNNISAYNENQGIVAVTKESLLSLRHNLAYANKKGNWNNDFSEWPLPTNFSLNPLFVDKDKNDFHLQPASAAKNAGDTAILDKDGSVSDVGAYGGPDVCALEPTLPECL